MGFEKAKKSQKFAQNEKKIRNCTAKKSATIVPQKKLRQCHGKIHDYAAKINWKTRDFPLAGWENPEKFTEKQKKVLIFLRR